MFVTKLTTSKKRLREAWGAGLVIVSDPAPAVAFNGRRIAWVQFRRWIHDAAIREQLGISQEQLPPMFTEDGRSKRRLLVELLERKPKVVVRNTASR